MKKLLIPLLLCFTIVNNAYAGWKKVASADIADFYIETSTIRTNGKYKEAWVLTDIKTPKKNPDGKAYLSTKAKYRFDCVGDKTNFLALVQYSGNMGEGEVVWSSSYNNNDWEHNVPGSAADSFTRAICSK